MQLNELTNPVDTLEASTEIPPILEVTRQWVETDPQGELRRIHIQGHPKVTCQVLILKRLPPETKLENFSDRI